ncbi:radical SAM protein [Aneurinibacillus terranovensis]|uniref:radical SAM protein n=1 Tax=Aneurinibacillus terranovensis TaxID=278991 RepID=UPI000423FA14|nr:radical SAM protein [Aneurinibacillus terranovensis]
MREKKRKLAILINPPVYDTQYWARWSMPHGLLKIGTWLKKSKRYDLRLFDCLNPYGKDSRVEGKLVDFEAYDSVRKQRKSVVVLASTEEREEPSSYRLQSNEKWKYIFGMPVSKLEEHLYNLRDEIASKKYKSVEFWITSIMTYWWESTRDVIQCALEIFPHAKIRVGGIYPTLAPWHARTKLGLEDPLVINGIETELNLDDDEMMSRHIILEKEVPQASDLDLATELYDDDERPPYTILTTSRGCPHICSYCASNVLNNGTKVRRRYQGLVMTEIKEKFRQGTKVFCFYEDNLLMRMAEFKDTLKAVMADKSLHGIKLFAPEGIEIGVALSDKKRFLLKLESDKSILATFSVDSKQEDKPVSFYEEYKKMNERKENDILITLEEDLTQGAVQILENTENTMKLLVGDQDEVILRKVYKEGGRHELVYDNKEESSLGLYMVGVPEVVYLMKLAGFEKIYLPLETIKKETNARWNRSWNSNLDRFESLLNALEEVGFDVRKQKINAFVMFGLPGEDLEEIFDTVLYASERVGSVIPMLFTPVPSTQVYKDYEWFIREKGYDLHHLNGKLFPFFPLIQEQMKMKYPQYELDISDYLRVEALMQRINTKILGQSVNICGDTKVSKIFRKTYSEYKSIVSTL